MLRYTTVFKAAFIVLSNLSVGMVVAVSPGFSQALAIDDDPAVTNAVTERAVESTADTVSETMGIPDFYPEFSRPEAAKEAVASDSEEAMRTLVEALDADNIEITETSVPLLELLRGDEREPIPTVQAPGASALTGLNSVGSKSVISVAITDKITPENLAALSASFQVDRASVPALRTALASDNLLTQLYAADALWSLTGDADLILSTLMSVAASDDVDAQALAIMAISQLGNKALPAVPLLNDLTGDRNSRTRRIAEDALAVVNSENRPSTVLGIIARETGRMVGMPGLFEVLSRLLR